MRSLSEQVAQQGPLSVRDALGWTLRASLTIASLHAEGWYHGRISAAAVLVADADCFAAGALLRPEMLADNPAYFGISRALGEEPTLDDDVWSLAVLLFFALTGDVPYPEGAAAAIENRRLRPSPPLALYRPELDVMQPLMDVLLGDRRSLASIDNFVWTLRDFSPAIADLEPLPLEPRASDRPMPQEPSGVEDASSELGPAAPRRGRRPLWPWVLLGVLSLVLLALVLEQRQDRPGVGPAASTPSASAPTPRTTGAPSLAVTAASAGATAPSAPPVESAASADGRGAEDMFACLAPIFEPRALGGRRPVAEFPCREGDAKRLVQKVDAALARATAASAAAEWALLGWYRLGAVAVARARCCQSPPALYTPRILALCKLDPALGALATATVRGSDADSSDALQGLGVALVCADTAGGGAWLEQTTPPTAQQAALLLRMIQRVRGAAAPR